MKNKIVYDGRTFEATDIKSGQIHLASSLPSMKLEPNTFTAVVKSEDKSLTEFTRNTPLYYYYRERLVCISYVQTVDRIGPNKYKFYGTSAIGRLIEQPHAGGIYTGQTAEEVITDICGPVPFEIKNVLKKIKLYGWLPYANPPKRSARDNLVQVLFAIGAAIRTDLDGVLRIEGLWDGISGTVGRDKMYTGANTEYDGIVTQVIVTEHQYVPWTEEKQLFEGTAQAGDVITFDEPMHDLVAQGFTIQASGANWARVSAGSGTLTGKTYIHNTRQVSKAVQEANTPNVKTVEDATLVSLANSTAVANRLADYYRCRERVDSAVVYQGETPGDRLATYHPFDKTGVAACLESADITLSNTLKAQEKLLVGYVPPQIGQTAIYTRVEVLTDSGTWAVPEGVDQIRVVCIGGGPGGTSGHSGTAGGPGVTYQGSKDREYNGNIYKTAWKGITAGVPGTPGQGGEPASYGGKIFSGTMEVTPGQNIQVVIGAGGKGRAGDHVAGDNGGDTTFGEFSSNNGSESPFGYLEEITGKIYADRGESSGIAGKRGGSSTKNTSHVMETTAGENLVYNGVTYTPGAYNGTSVPIQTQTESGLYTYSTTQGLGGGPAAGKNGGSQSGGNGGRGATPVAPAAATVRGRGGNGGHGGGAGGAPGGRETYWGEGKNENPPYFSYPSNMSAGIGGTGGPGGDGAPGCVIIYYSIKKKEPSGQLIDKNNRMVLDRLGRRIIV